MNTVFLNFHKLLEKDFHKIARTISPRPLTVTQNTMTSTAYVGYIVSEATIYVYEKTW